MTNKLLDFWQTMKNDKYTQEVKPGFGMVKFSILNQCLEIQAC